MQRFWLSVSILASLALLQAAKKPAPGEADNEKVEIIASVVQNDQLNQSFNHDFQDHFTVVEVRVVPKNGPIDIRLDDFMLRSDRDGDHGTPFPATQITGDGALLVTHVTAPAGPTGNTTDRGWRLPGGIGSSGGGNRRKKKTEQNDDNNRSGDNKSGDNKSSSDKSSKDKDEEPKTDPELRAKLTARVLEEKTTSQPISGLLFFSLEKQKAKDLELIYTTAAGKLHLRFK